MDIMRFTQRRAFWATVTLVLVSPQAVVAQARSRLRFREVGYLRKVGDSTIRTQFQPYSYGLGSLRSSSVGGSVLRSSIRSSPFSLRRSLGDPGRPALRSDIGVGGPLRRATPTNLGALTSGPLRPPPKRSIMASAGPRPPAGAVGLPPINLPSGFGRSPERPMGLALGGGGGAYLAAMRKVASQTLVKDAAQITSLVPKQDSPFRRYLAQGEQAFRKGRFRKAANAFRLAGYLAPQSPEYLLSMAHAEFALSPLAYSSVSFYLRQALKHFPELALVPLRPKALYGREETYAGHVERLAKHVRERPADADAQLTLAYFRWFEGRSDEAAAALSQARRYSKNTSDRIARNRLEAIDVFQAGMVASGRISPAERATPRPGKAARVKAAGTSAPPAAPPAKP